ncbi:hypothetical protein PHLCEN_2v13328 [Hermanssonia centrifuga]|uniref:Uncharacterized protein n=1 Tax=Hermanssonia centrifuga TaxID=98765 RepID=A0A2R6NEQ4_9APHY|nr:hypothetical protein PHLCEN_2v13328 [Hermanssonia centrifuga]
MSRDSLLGKLEAYQHQIYQRLRREYHQRAGPQQPQQGAKWVGSTACVKKAHFRVFARFIDAPQRVESNSDLELPTPNGGYRGFKKHGVEGKLWRLEQADVPPIPYRETSITDEETKAKKYCR